jgi:hypothetical protein
VGEGGSGHQRLAGSLVGQRLLDRCWELALLTYLTASPGAAETSPVAVSALAVAVVGAAASWLVGRRNRRLRQQLGVEPFACRILAPNPAGEHEYVRANGTGAVARAYRALTWLHGVFVAWVVALLVAWLGFDAR